VFTIFVALSASLGASPTEADDPKPVRIIGKVKALVESGAETVGFEATTKSGPLTVELVTETALVLAAGRPFLNCGGEESHLLARDQPAQRDPSSGTQIPASYAQILTIVTGGPFAPSPDTGGVPGGVKWFQGQIRDDPKKNGPWIGGRQLTLGIDRIVWALSEAKRADLKKGAALLVDGDLQKIGKSRVASARRVVILGAQAPVGELKFLYGEFQ